MPEDTPGDAETQTAATRYRWTNDILAGVLVLASVGVALGSFVLEAAVPGEFWTVFTVEVLLAATWAFGRETLMAIRDFRAGKGGEGGA